MVYPVRDDKELWLRYLRRPIGPSLHDRSVVSQVFLHQCVWSLIQIHGWAMRIWIFATSAVILCVFNLDARTVSTIVRVPRVDYDGDRDWVAQLRCSGS